jgi:hypothetical protein
MLSAICWSLCLLHYNVEYVGHIGDIFFRTEMECIIYGLYYETLLQEPHKKFVKSFKFLRGS